MWHSATRLSGGRGSTRLAAGLDLKALSQPQRPDDSLGNRRLLTQRLPRPCKSGSPGGRGERGQPGRAQLGCAEGNLALPCAQTPGEKPRAPAAPGLPPLARKTAVPKPRGSRRALQSRGPQVAFVKLPHSHQRIDRKEKQTSYKNKT